MKFLSLQEPVESPILKVGRSGAILLSLGLHLLLLLLFLLGPGMASRILPPAILALFDTAPPARTPEPAQPVAPQTRTAAKIPLRFEYVRTPDDNRVEKNPAARVLSDKSRQARQEMPTPPSVRQLSDDPHSQGTTVERIRPDPRLAEGRDALEPAPPGSEGSDQRQNEARPSPDREGTSRTDGADVAGRNGGEDGSPAAHPTGDQGFERQPGTGSPPGDPTTRKAEAARESLRRALSGQGEESKRLYDNPGYLSPGIVSGTMSFDTQDFPWGDYARRIKVIIDNSWGGRLPLAFRDGVRGYLCVHFVIQKDGTISDVQVVRPSSVPPFNRAVLDTLREVSPLPGLPEGFPGEQEGISWCFFYNMLPGEIRELMR